MEELSEFATIGNLVVCSVLTTVVLWPLSAVVSLETDVRPLLDSVLLVRRLINPVDAEAANVEGVAESVAIALDGSSADDNNDVTVVDAFLAVLVLAVPRLDAVTLSGDTDEPMKSVASDAASVTAPAEFALVQTVFSKTVTGATIHTHAQRTTKSKAYLHVESDDSVTRWYKALALLLLLLTVALTTSL